MLWPLQDGTGSSTNRSSSPGHAFSHARLALAITCSAEQLQSTPFSTLQHLLYSMRCCAQHTDATTDPHRVCTVNNSSPQPAAAAAAAVPPQFPVPQVLCHTAAVRLAGTLHATTIKCCVCGPAAETQTSHTREDGKTSCIEPMRLSSKRKNGQARERRGGRAVAWPPVLCPRCIVIQGWGCFG